MKASAWHACVGRQWQTSLLPDRVAKRPCGNTTIARRSKYRCIAAFPPQTATLLSLVKVLLPSDRCFDPLPMYRSPRINLLMGSRHPRTSRNSGKSRSLALRACLSQLGREWSSLRHFKRYRKTERGDKRYHCTNHAWWPLRCQVLGRPL